MISTFCAEARRIGLAIAILIVFATAQVYVGVSFAEPGSLVSGESVATAPQQPTGILTTQGNKEITVNGTNSISGATVVSGVSIETPAGVSATVSLGTSGSLEIEPNTKLTVEFEQGGVKVLLTEGCGSLRTRKGTTGEISTPKGSAGKTDPAQDGRLEICPRRIAALVVAAGTSGLFSLGRAAAVAIIARGVTSVAVPVTPRGVLY
jgi:hypothetical protein